MRRAAAQGARVVLFPEGLLSGYAKHPIRDWADVDWPAVRDELASIVELAGTLRLWVVLGSAHRLTPPHWPHNSLYVISDAGRIADRYDKRFCSYTETTQFYTPGFEPVVFEVDGYRFGCAICWEINFPQVFVEYRQLGVDCVLLSAYPVDSIFYTKAVAYAAIHNYWISLSIPSDCASLMKSGVIGPDGVSLAQVDRDEGLAICDLDRSEPDVSFAREFRAAASEGTVYALRRVEDPRSADRTCM